MNAQGNTVTLTILSAISALINVILDPFFIFTFNLGIAGAAWATVLSRVVLALLGIKIIFKEDNDLKPDFRGFKFDKDIITLYGLWIYRTYGWKRKTLNSIME